MAIDERELDDVALVEAAQDGDDEAFAELFRRHYPTVRRVCARRLGNAGEADEVAQAAFVRAYERLHLCAGERRFGAWVQVIANNIGTDTRRRAARSLPMDEPFVSDGRSVPNPCEDHVLLLEQTAQLHDVLLTLPPRQREVLIARDLEGRRPGEIAASLGVSLGAVDSLLLRARRRMALVWRVTGPERGGVTFPVTSASAVATTAAAAPGPISHAVVTVGHALATASYRIAASLGVVPGASSLSSKLGGAVGGVALVGTLAGAPVVASQTPRPVAHPAGPVITMIPVVPAVVKLLPAIHLHTPAPLTPVTGLLPSPTQGPLAGASSALSQVEAASRPTVHAATTVVGALDIATKIVHDLAGTVNKVVGGVLPQGAPPLNKR